jgi:hypothetical protein
MAAAHTGVHCKLFTGKKLYYQERAHHLCMMHDDQ